ncbi:MAG: GNAT family N-acetyltransferase [Lutimonas sp.]
MNFRKGNSEDLEQLKALGVKSWSQFKNQLTDQHWSDLYKTINNKDTYANLLKISDCVICENNDQKIIGMAFLVPKGNPTEIYDATWCHLRFVSVDPTYRGQKIGETLTGKCIEIALQNNEQMMALHTAELMYSARHIYEKIGFKVLKAIEPKFGLKYWLYTLELDKANRTIKNN